MKLCYLGWMLLLFACQTEKNMQKENCDPETGVCTPANLAGESDLIDTLRRNELSIIYVGDPMCSWCYGIAPELKLLKEHYANQGIQFDIIAGGLRPGGGDEWNLEMKEMLQHHWEQVEEKSGQKFSYKLFEREAFNYDTEPGCRAVVVAKDYLKHDLLLFFEAIQKKFYIDSEDPNEVAFYESLCLEFEIPFAEFKIKFGSKEMKEKTHKEFVLNREWGVTGYPSVLVKRGDQLEYIARGYSSFNQMKNLLEQLK